MINLERNVDVDKFSTEEAEQLATQIGDKVKSMVDETANKINELLSIYGMSARFECVIEGGQTKNKPKQSSL